VLTPNLDATDVTLWPLSTTCETASRLNSSVYLILALMEHSLLPFLRTKVSTKLGAHQNDLGDAVFPSEEKDGPCVAGDLLKSVPKDPHVITFKLIAEYRSPSLPKSDPPFETIVAKEVFLGHGGNVVNANSFDNGEDGGDGMSIRIFFAKLTSSEGQTKIS
jgi:hypothetical protein